MKKHFLNLRNIVSVLAITALTFTATASFATRHYFEIKVDTKVDPSVTYVSSNDYSSTFLVNVNADDVFKFQLLVKDKAGVVLFSRNFNTAKLSKTFTISNEELGAGPVTFTIKNLETGDNTSFKVNSEVKVNNEVHVTKTL